MSNLPSFPSVALVIARSRSLREAMIALLTSILPDDEILGTGELETGLSLVAERKPHLLLIDYTSAGAEAWQALRQIKSNSPETRRVVLADSVQQQIEIETPAAEAVLLKGSSPRDLAAVIAGLVHCPPDVGKFS